MIAMERQPPPTRLLHNIERVQGWSMLLYGPLEALAYLGSHSIVGITKATQGKLWLASARLWALYVMLQCLHLVEDNRILRLRARALERTRGHPVPVGGARRSQQKQTSGASSSALSEKAGAAVEGYNVGGSGAGSSEEQALTRSMWNELDQRKSAILNELWINIGYLPLTIHWWVGTRVGVLMILACDRRLTSPLSWLKVDHDWASERRDCRLLWADRGDSWLPQRLARQRRAQGAHPERGGHRVRESESRHPLPFSFFLSALRLGLLSLLLHKKEEREQLYHYWSSLLLVRALVCIFVTKGRTLTSAIFTGKSPINARGNCNRYRSGCYMPAYRTGHVFQPAESTRVYEEDSGILAVVTCRAHH